MAWSAADLGRIGSVRELEISTPRADGTDRRWTPIWVVRVDDQVYVRSWHRRRTGWFGDAVRDRRARVRFGDQERAVEIDDLESAPADLQDRVSRAYADKYGAVADMITVAATATTLGLRAANRA